MKRKEKNRETKRKIMEQALAEFAQNGYDDSSVNTICTEGISKGIIYHYFDTKNDLYPACVQECFDALCTFINDHWIQMDNPSDELEEYFSLRASFFQLYQVYQPIFCEAMISHPKELMEQIRERMQGYQPVASYAFGAKNDERFHQSVHFAIKGSIALTLLAEAVCILFSKQMISLFNRNPDIIMYGSQLLRSQVALYPAFGLCYMMTITFQTIRSSGYGLFQSIIRQGLFHVPFILILPGILAFKGISLAQPCANILTIIVCLFSIRPMKKELPKPCVRYMPETLPDREWFFRI